MIQVGINKPSRKLPLTLVEEVIEQKRLKFEIVVVCFGDVTQEHTLKKKIVNVPITILNGTRFTLMIHPPRHIEAIPA